MQEKKNIAHGVLRRSVQLTAASFVATNDPSVPARTGHRRIRTPTYNEEERIEHTIECVRRQGPEADLEIIVGDGGDDDGDHDRVLRYRTKAFLMISEKVG